MPLFAVFFQLCSLARAQELRFPPDMSSVRSALGSMTPPPAVKPAPVTPASIWYEPPIPGLDSPESRAYADEAARAAAQTRDFPAILAALSRRLPSPLGRRPRHELANLFRGLIAWSRRGGTSLFQDRDDWPRHFVYGGYIAAVYGYPAAEAAAFAKEDRDARAPGNEFDLDDLAATLLGARWAHLALSGGGLRELSAVAPLKFGKLPHGRLPSRGQVKAVSAFVRAALP